MYCRNGHIACFLHFQELITAWLMFHCYVTLDSPPLCDRIDDSSQFVADTVHGVVQDKTTRGTYSIERVSTEIKNSLLGQTNG